MELPIWQFITGYEGLYQVSNTGLVRSLQKGKPKLLKPREGKSGYLAVVLCKGGYRKTVDVHRLVATTFIENKSAKCCVNHKNGIKTDNREDNLEWVTHSENILHAYARDLIKRKGRYMIIDLNTGVFYLSIREAAERTGCDEKTILQVLGGRGKRTSSWNFARVPKAEWIYSLMLYELKRNYEAA